MRTHQKTTIGFLLHFLGESLVHRVQCSLFYLSGDQWRTLLLSAAAPQAAPAVAGTSGGKAQSRRFSTETVHGPLLGSVNFRDTARQSSSTHGAGDIRTTGLFYEDLQARETRHLSAVRFGANWRGSREYDVLRARLRK